MTHYGTTPSHVPVSGHLLTGALRERGMTLANLALAVDQAMPRANDHEHVHRLLVATRDLGVGWLDLGLYYALLRVLDVEPDALRADLFWQRVEASVTRGTVEAERAGSLA
jgi:hypothetical protein